MQTRRTMLKGGLGVLAWGATAPLQAEVLKSLLGPMDNTMCGEGFPAEPDLRGSSGTINGFDPEYLKASRPLAPRMLDPNPRMINGLPFRNWFEGDDFEADIPFHTQQNNFPDGNPPAPSEEIDVVIIGGGISGLSTAFELRDYNPVVFELHDRFGGNAQGGTINGEEFSLGSAYFITPDPGLPLDNFYRALGLHDVVRVDESPSPVEINGTINDDIWTGMGVPKGDIPAYEAYRKLVEQMTIDYPDVPFPEQWMIDLDRLSLRQHIEQEVGLPIPDALAAAIQAYCYSSFGAGWEEISATLGWNFLAAEEFGRWVLPGGNAWMANRLWEELQPLDARDPAHAPHLRPGRYVVDTRQQPDGRWLVTWKEPDGSFVSLLAREVVMACPKNIARAMIPGLQQEDEARYNAMRLNRRAYLVANVIMNQPIPDSFYDIFLLENPSDFPHNAGEAGQMWRYTDVLNGSYTTSPGGKPLPVQPGILTLYWPLAFEDARFTLFLGDPILEYGKALTNVLHDTLDLIGMDASDVLEIRFARWGHALPEARIGFLSDGIPQLIRAPYKESMHFVNQDNWALPAIENSLLDAFEVAATIRKRLG